jgi:predicted AlkP superfamily pyrophosphatase or phosphodiesterase
MGCRVSPLLLLAAFAVPLAAQRPAAPPVRLVLHLGIDQLRPDYLQRWEDELPGGLGRLVREGVVFFAGEQDHAMTETAPGHATMLTGRTPAHVGIVSNDLGVPDRLYPLVSGTGGGASPARVRGTTLYDWLRAADPDVRALSISRKDRGAILPIGRAKVPVFWWAKGVFTTSRWYGDSLPTWLQAWNARDPIEQLRGTAWTLLRDSSSYPEPDDRPFEYAGNDRTFPHLLPDDWTMAGGVIEYRSQMDSLTLDAAWHGVRALGLGTRDGTDLLAISLSTLDAVGHRWGPGSREVHDHVLRLDQWLGQFLDSLATQVPLNQVVITLTSDHGVQEYPEAGAGGRQSLSRFARELNAGVRARWGVEVGAVAEGGLLFGDRAALQARGVDVDSLSSALAAAIDTMPGIARVHTPRTLAAAPREDPSAGLWRRSLPADFQWLVAAELEDGWMWNTGRSSTSHSTTALQNRRVPILFRVPGLAPARPSRVIRTVDIAPTLAALLGILPTESLDGVPLPEVLGSRPMR